MTTKKTALRPHQPSTFSRREFVGKLAPALGISIGWSYLSLAPAEFPFSLHDPDGRRGQPTPPVFKLPDFRVSTPPNGVAVGISHDSSPEIRLKKALDAVGGLTHFIQPGDTVLIKPNAAFDRAPMLGATSSPEIISALIHLLFTEGKVKEVRVTDNPIESPADCFAKSGLENATIRAGGQIYLPDANAFRILQTPGAVLISHWHFLYRPFQGVTKVIGVAPVKDHNLCQASMGMKNWYGLLGGRRNQFHQNIHEVVSDLALMIKPTLTILDGSRILMRNGPTGGNLADVKISDTIVVGTDPVATDAWAYRHLLERTDELPQYLFKAQEKGAGKIDSPHRIVEVG